MALELFQLASLLIGEESKAMLLIEDSLATMDADPCAEPTAARAQARKVVVEGAIRTLAQQSPGAFQASAATAAAGPCVQDDDLQAAGVTPEQLRNLLDEHGRPELRHGLRVQLEQLPIAQRAVFVQRAVLGQSNDAAAQLLREAAGPDASGWTAETVSGTFRQALCSLANALAHAPGSASAASVSSAVLSA
ncbi:hypothetical protein D1Y84_12120 [Acidipila sp. EB88]|nr:hypothetical protein D1Y84_12120 [Acidipila sp. EB88]